MKIKTSELTGAALDWAVAKCEGLPLRLDPMGNGSSDYRYWVWPENWPPSPAYQSVGGKYSPSKKWDQGGPIIEREYIELNCFVTMEHAWDAMIRDADAEPWVERGPTPLIAAMRCYVASNLGDDIDLPKELL